MDKFVKRKKVSELRDGENVDDIFFVKFKKGVSGYVNGFSFELTLSDTSGKNIDYKYWGGKDEGRLKALYDSIYPDSIVRVQGKVSSYKGRPQLATNEPAVIEVLQEGQYDGADFVKPAKRDVDAMYAELLLAVSSVKHPKLKLLLEGVFNDKELATKFRKHPGAIAIHHNWTGGLLQHTLEVLSYCKTSLENFPSLDRDLLYVGALLHDIGKLEELAVTSRIKGTRKGQLAGHLVLGSVFVSNKCDEVGLEDDLKDKLLHILVSHHGKPEFGSPKEPMIPEAVVVYYADELSAKVAEVLEFVEESKLETEDDFMYHKRYGKNILLK
jgi:3'-5' exoribonuclease